MSAVPALKVALLALLRSLYPEAAVSYGPPQLLTDVMASVGDAEVEHERPTAGGPTRSREEVADIEVILSCAAHGDGESLEDAQREATEAAYGMLAVLETHFRDRAAATLGGACRDALVRTHKLAEYVSTDPDGYVTGRVGEITATVTCRTRI
jgi:hypothetical protein